MRRRPLCGPRVHRARVRRTRAATALLGWLAGGCLPYTVASTARPLAAGEQIRTATWYAIPNAVEVEGDSVSGPMYGIDAETRFGLDDRSDVGLRVPSFAGAVVTYKRRLDGPTAKPGPAVAAMVGAGIINFGAHAHAELTLIASARDETAVVPYGGLRVMQAVPMSRGVPSDTPTAGGFFGVRLGRHDLGISPEVGVYYDRSTLGLRKSRVIVVPAVSLHRDTRLRVPAWFH